MTESYLFVPATCNLQAFLREEADEYGDGVATLLSFARTTLESMESAMTEEEFSMRHVALLGAEEAWTFDDDIDAMRAELQRTFADWPEPLLAAA